MSNRVRVPSTGGSRVPSFEGRKEALKLNLAYTWNRFMNLVEAQRRGECVSRQEIAKAEKEYKHVHRKAELEDLNG